MKALKYMGLPAISRNMWQPIVRLSDAEWACNLVHAQTTNIIGKFHRNELGSDDGDESKQRLAVIRIVREYMSRDHASLEKYDVNAHMHRAAVITHSYIARRLATLPAFAKDRNGATAALKRTIQRMLDDDELREMPGKQTMELFGLKPKAYVMSNPKAFL